MSHPTHAAPLHPVELDDEIRADAGTVADAETIADTEAEVGEVGGRQRRGSAVVAAVLEATRQELVRVGYFELRIDEVARVAGVNKTTIYRRWPSRLPLVRDALAEHLAAVERPPTTGQVSVDLRRHMYALCALTDTPVGMAMLAARVQANDNLEVVQLMEQMRLIHEEGPRRILERGKADGQLAPDLDVELALGMIHGAFQHRLADQPRCIEPGFVDIVVDLLMNGIGRSPQG